jgi:Cell cycle protein
MRVAHGEPDPFASLLGVGLSALLAVEVLINIAVVIGLVPTKGLPLPFLSYGGSSILMALAQLGVLLALSSRAPLNSVAKIEYSARQVPAGLLRAASLPSTFSSRSRRDASQGSD